MAVMYWLILVALLLPLASFPATTGIGIAQAKNAAFIVLGLIGLVWLVPGLWLRAFLVWTMLAFVAAGMHSWALAGMLGLLAWVACYFLIARLNRSAWRTVCVAVSAAALFQVAWMGLQFAGHDPVFWGLSDQGGVRFEFEGRARPSECLPGPFMQACVQNHLAAGYLLARPPAIGWFSNGTDTALFLGLSLPAVAAISPWLAVPVVFALLAFLRSTVGLLLVVLTACWWCWRRGWRGASLLVASLAGLGIPLYVWLLDPAGLAHRWVIWQHAWALSLIRPVVGWGPNAVGHRLRIQAAGERWEFLHQEWLQGALEFGWVGVALALATAVSFALAAWRRGLADVATAGFLAVLVASCFAIPFRIGPTAFLSALYLGRLMSREDSA